MQDSFSQTEEDKSSMATAPDSLKVGDRCMVRATVSAIDESSDGTWIEVKLAGHPQSPLEFHPDDLVPTPMRETGAAGQLSALQICGCILFGNHTVKLCESHWLALSPPFPREAAAAKPGPLLPDTEMRAAAQALLHELDELERTGGMCIPSLGACERLRTAARLSKPGPAEAPPRPKIICLCGSTRFYETFQKANYDETMTGNIVLSVGFYPHAQREMHHEEAGCTPEQKIALDELHKWKIDIADEVFVLNVGGYIGSSTRSEIAYAEAHGKPVRYLEALAASVPPPTKEKANEQ